MPVRIADVEASILFPGDCSPPRRALPARAPRAESDGQGQVIEIVARGERGVVLLGGPPVSSARGTAPGGQESGARRPRPASLAKWRKSRSRVATDRNCDRSET